MRAVILVHGIFDTSRIFSRMASRLQACGFRPLALNLTPSNGAVGLDLLATQIGMFVDQHLAPAEQFDLVGFSMGGLIARAYLASL